MAWLIALLSSAQFLIRHYTNTTVIAAVAAAAQHRFVLRHCVPDLFIHFASRFFFHSAAASKQQQTSNAEME